MIATASADGEPWVSPVFYNYDRDLHLYFESAADARHSRLIATNPRVAVVVSELGAAPVIEGVYFEAEAREVPLDRIAHALDIFQDGPHERVRNRRTTADYGAEKPLRLYEAVPHAVYGLSQVKVEGYEVEQRIPLDLSVLIGQLREV